MGGNLIYYAIVFLIVAIVAAALGFAGLPARQSQVPTCC